MKKLVLLTLAALMIVGCNQRQIANSITKDDFGVCVYDSCEYLFAAHGNQGYLAHKGNCRYCQQRMRKLMMEVRDSLLWQTE